MYSSLFHSKIVEFLVTHVNTILCCAYVRFPPIKVLFNVTSCSAVAGDEEDYCHILNRKNQSKFNVRIGVSTALIGGEAT